MSGAVRAGVGKEQLLAPDRVIGDGLLAVPRDDPVDEGLPVFFFHMRKFFRIQQNDSVLVEKPVVAFDGDCEVAAALERDPGAAIGSIGRRGSGGRMPGGGMFAGGSTQFASCFNRFRMN